MFSRSHDAYSATTNLVYRSLFVLDLRTFTYPHRCSWMLLRRINLLAWRDRSKLAVSPQGLRAVHAPIRVRSVYIQSSSTRCRPVAAASSRRSWSRTHSSSSTTRYCSASIPQDDFRFAISDCRLPIAIRDNLKSEI